MVKRAYVDRFAVVDDRIDKERKKVARRVVKNSEVPVMREKKVEVKLASVAASRAGNGPVGRPNDIITNSKAVGLLYGYDNMARSINDFMHVGRPGRSAKKVHTVAEHEAFLKKLLENCWNCYNDGMKKVGGE